MNIEEKLRLIAVVIVFLLAPGLKADDSKIIGFSFDANWGQRDFGDRRGDIKFVHITSRYKDKVWFLRTGIDTPQISLSGEQFDTGILSIYGGKEYKNISFYLGVDAYNGKVLSAAQDTIKAIHSLTGKGTRMSPASSGFKITPVAIGRFDESFSLGPWASIHGVMVGKVSNGNNYLGAGGFIRLGKASEWKPNVYGLPSMDPGSSSIYAGGTIEYVFNELVTKKVGTKATRIAGKVGGVWQISEKVTLDASFTKFFSSSVKMPQIISGSTKPVEEINFNLSIKF